MRDLIRAVLPQARVIASCLAVLVASYSVSALLRPEIAAAGRSAWWVAVFGVSVVALAAWSWFTLSEHVTVLQGAAASTVTWQRIAVVVVQWLGGLAYFGSVAFYVLKHEGWLR